ncbi:hypothetical protein COOONC_25807 [Cooperia oncophora]
MDYIINRFRKEDPTKTSKLSLVVKRDLRSIIKKHDDDLTSLQLRFGERNPDVGIRCLQLPEDPSGMGICGLVTLMVSDEKDRGLPGGSAQVVMNLSSQWNNDKSRCPEVVHGSEEFIAQFFPTTMMTDEARVFTMDSVLFSRKRVPYMANVGKENNRACEGIIALEGQQRTPTLAKRGQLGEFERRSVEILMYVREKNQGLLATYLERNYLGTSFYYMVDT